MYVGPGDAGVTRALWATLLGLVYLRELASDGDLERLRALRSAWAERGRDVPIFAVSAEEVEEVRWWRPDARIDLAAPPYKLEQLEP